MPKNIYYCFNHDRIGSQIRERLIWRCYRFCLIDLDKVESKRKLRGNLPLLLEVLEFKKAYW